MLSKNTESGNSYTRAEADHIQFGTLRQELILEQVVRWSLQVPPAF